MQNRKEEYEGFAQMMGSRNIEDLEMGLAMLKGFGFKHATKGDAEKLCYTLINKTQPYIKYAKNLDIRQRNELKNRVADIVTKLSNKYGIKLAYIVDYNDIADLMHRLHKEHVKGTN